MSSADTTRFADLKARVETDTGMKLLKSYDENDPRPFFVLADDDIIASPSGMSLEDLERFCKEKRKGQATGSPNRESDQGVRIRNKCGCAVAPTSMKKPSAAVISSRSWLLNSNIRTTAPRCRSRSQTAPTS